MTALASATVLMLAFQQAGVAAPAHGFERILDNERVIIWAVRDVAADAPLLPDPSLPGVLISLADGSVRFVTRFVRSEMAGDAGPGGSTAAASRRAVLIQLKEHRAGPVEVPRGVAPAFPRPEARNVVDNERVAIWEVAWTTGLRTPVHFHDRDVVAVYLGAGTVRSISLDGKATATPRSFGEVVFLPRGRTHVEECIDGPRRDLIIELK
jgi:hypothetical protein